MCPVSAITIYFTNGKTLETIFTSGTGEGVDFTVERLPVGNIQRRVKEPEAQNVIGKDLSFCLCLIQKFLWYSFNTCDLKPGTNLFYVFSFVFCFRFLVPYTFCTHLTNPKILLDQLRFCRHVGPCIRRISSWSILDNFFTKLLVSKS